MELRLGRSDRPLYLVAGRPLLVARSHQEVFKCVHTVVLDIAPTWADEGATVAVTGPLLTRAEVQSAFDQISEKYHVSGIDLCFSEEDGGRLQAIVRPSRRWQHP
jgi:hypothetical protein